MKSLLKRISGDQSPGAGDGPGFPHAVAQSVHSLLHRFSSPMMSRRHEAVGDIPRQPSGPSPEDTATTASQTQTEIRPNQESNNELHVAGHAETGGDKASTIAAAKESQLHGGLFSPDLHLSPGPQSSTTTQEASTAGAKAQNARKKSLDPLQRYFSARSHSFPDYGRIDPEVKKMGGRFLRRLNAYYAGGPVDTMSSSKTQTVGSSPSAVEGRHAGPKRQKTNHSGHYTTLAFAPLPDYKDTAKDRITQTERRGSQSNVSTEDRTWDSCVSEYRAVEGLHDPRKRPRGHRSRPPRGRLMHLDSSMDTKDPIQDDSDDSITESRAPARPNVPGTEFRGNGRVKSRSARDSADLAILGSPTNSTKSTAKPDTVPPTQRGKKRLQESDMNDEVDELAADSEYQPYKRLNPGQKRHQPAQSSSISTRGDLKPSLATGKGSAPLEAEPLPLKALAWPPTHIYEASDSATDGQSQGSLVIGSRPGASDTASLTLRPTATPAEEAPEYSWFQVDSRKIDRVKINYDKCLVKMSLPINLSSNLGATLYLQFFCEEDTRDFHRWISRYFKVPSTLDPRDELPREFAKQYAEIKKRPTPKVALGANAPIDAADSAKSTRRGIAASATARPERRLFDTLGSSSKVGSGPFGYPMSEDEVTELSRPRRSVRTRRDFNSPDLGPMPQRWTEIHPDWDKNWRLPLSFHRTAVEKDDIARLDEGQCLNDNIIGFYLKYLQVQAEQQRPETSKRIYFHNSFFYSKLKPTSGRQINFDGVKNWTAKVDIFSYDYIIVPVNEHFHWWVAIICNPGKLDSTVAENAVGSPDSNDDLEEVMAVSSTADAVARSPQRDNSVVVVQDRRPVSEDKEDVRHREDSFKIPVSGDEGDIKTTQLDKGSEVAMVVGDDAATAPAKSSAPQRGRKRGRKSVGGAQRKYNPAEPRIITLDSLGASHSPVCTHLKQYLIAEFKDKKGKDVEYNQSSIGMRATNIPEQDNFCDCGVYLLKYVAEFLGEPDKFIQSILLREGREWDFDASKMRDGIRQLIFDLHEPYQKEQEDAKRQKAQAKRRREQSKSEGPPDDSGPSALHASAERAVSPQKVGGSTPSVSVRASPVVEHPPTPRLPAATTPEIVTIEQARSSLKAQQKGPSESAQQPGNRSVLVVDIKAGKPGAAKVATPQLQPSAVQASHALPSIEIPDDDEVPPESPHQTQPVSRGTSLSVGALSVVEETDDKVVLIRPQTTASEHKPHSSVSQNELGSEGFYRAADDGNSKESTKPTSPVKKAMVSSTRASWGGPPEESPYFGRTPYNRDQPSRPRKTYKGSRKTSSGGTIDLTDD